MKQRIVILLIVFFPFVANARYGYMYNNFTLFYGGYITNNTQVLSSFEFLYDRAFKSCMTRPTYYGLGVIGTFSPSFNEYGIKGLINPFRTTYNINRSARISPYFFGQGNLYQSKLNSSYSNDFNFRPGLGFNTSFRSNKKILLRTSVQVGYTIPINTVEQVNGFVFEFKVGLGINTARFRKKKEERPPIQM